MWSAILSSWSYLIFADETLVVLHSLCRRQRIKREEAQYASSGSMSFTYGKGWTDDDGEEESVYATVAEVEMFRDGCVNPAVGDSGEPQVKTTTDAAVECKLDRQQCNTVDREDSYDRLSLSERIFGNCIKKARSDQQTGRHVTVIEVHKAFDTDSSVSGPAGEPQAPSLHTSACLDACTYASVTPPGTNRCVECNIARPPRRRDADKCAYDNNISVKSSTKLASYWTGICLEKMCSLVMGYLLLKQSYIFFLRSAHALDKPSGSWTHKRRCNMQCQFITGNTKREGIEFELSCIRGL